MLSFSEHADDPLAESFTLGAEEGNEEMETTEGQNGDHEGEGEEEVAEVGIFAVSFRFNKLHMILEVHNYYTSVRGITVWST